MKEILGIIDARILELEATYKLVEDKQEKMIWFSRHIEALLIRERILCSEAGLALDAKKGDASDVVQGWK